MLFRSQSAVNRLAFDKCGQWSRRRVRFTANIDIRRRRSHVLSCAVPCLLSSPRTAHTARRRAKFDGSQQRRKPFAFSHLWRTFSPRLGSIRRGPLPASALHAPTLRRITKQTLLLGCATIPERVASSAGELRLEEGSALFVPAATPTQLSLRRTLQSPRASGNSMPRIRARSSFSRSAICRTGSTPVKRFGRRPRATSTDSLRAFTASSMAGKTLIGSRSRWPTLAFSLRC